MHTRCCYVLSLVAAFAGIARADTKLTDDDRKFLAAALKSTFFDPKGAERVVIEWEVGSDGPARAEAWRVAGKVGKPDRFFDADGSAHIAPLQCVVRSVDFVTACRSNYARENRRPLDDPNRDWAKRPAKPDGADESDLTLAVWLYQLGELELAAEALTRVNDVDSTLKSVRDELLYETYSKMIDTFRARNDALALEYAEHIQRRFAIEIEDDDFECVAPLATDLKRRLKQPAVKSRAELPADLKNWTADRKITFLIDRLDECEHSSSIPFVDRLYKELRQCGERAIPALIDALDRDERLTRSIRNDIFFHRRQHRETKKITSIREVADQLLTDLLRVSQFDPTDVNEALSRPDAVRAYWKHYGRLPFDVRMMSILIDSKCTFVSRREAAWNLANLTGPQSNWLKHTDGGLADKGNEGVPNPVIAKFSNPTVAEAILACMTAEMPRVPDTIDSNQEPVKRGMEDDYRRMLIDLGDLRAAKACVRLADSNDLVQCRDWAMTAHVLGDSSAIKALAKQITLGKWEAPPRTERHSRLINTLGQLARANLPETERTLETIVRPDHPWYEPLAQESLGEDFEYFDRSRWSGHRSYCQFLRNAFDDLSFSGRRFAIVGKMLKWSRIDQQSGSSIPPCLADPNSRRESADERLCDAAAARLSNTMIGLPTFHVLMVDADERREAIRKAFDRWSDGVRIVNETEAQILHCERNMFIPDFRPLGRAATADDVKAGRAIFHLQGLGTPAKLMLPAVAELKGEQPENAVHALIVQAEVSRDGQTTYGLLLRHGTRTVAATEVISVKSIAEFRREDQDPRRYVRFRR